MTSIATCRQVPYHGFKLEITASDGSVCTLGPAPIDDDHVVVIERSKYSTLDLRNANLDFVSPYPEGTLSGLFSVSATKQVRFAKGNLQYRASTNTWRFAEHQWDRIGQDNSNISATYDGWIDLFGWGTSGWSSGAQCYMPYCTQGGVWDEDWEDWIVNPDSEYLNHSLTGDYAEADWAYHNAISNGGAQAHTWRTLTIDEWNYLFQRHGRLGYGNINGVNGIILLPDVWNAPSGVTLHPYDDNASANQEHSYSDNSFTATAGP